MDLVASRPRAPDWRVEWSALEEAFDWVRALASCPQDPVHHAEGDVGTHTLAVLEELARSAAYRALDGPDQEAVYLACLLHDVGKPATTRRDPDGRITSRGHSRKGALLARRILYGLGVPFALRERVCALVRRHQLPFFLIEEEDLERKAITASITARCDLLALVAEADARGRECADKGAILDRIELFREACSELGCLQVPLRFASDHSRFLYFRTEGRSPRYAAHDDTQFEVTVLSGLPGAGKDRWLAAHGGGRPSVSLDAAREELDVSPTEGQAPVAAAAREKAREHLRRRNAFVWNATNLGREMRARWTGLFASYGAAIRIVYVEVPEPALRLQNRSRPRPVPDAVMDRLLERWEVPDLTECHSLELVVTDGDCPPRKSTGYAC
jgi:putative nucleotidyltransferase with HDIG domain